MNTINIICLPPERWREYKEIRLESLQKEPQAFGKKYEEAIKDPDEKWQQSLEKAERKETSIILFVESGNKVIGLAGAFFDINDKAKGAMIYGVYVTNEFRGKGIGKQLILQLINKIKAVPGITKVSLMVNQDEIPAIKVYEKNGFKVVGTKDWVLGDGKNHELFVMERNL